MARLKQFITPTNRIAESGEWSLASPPQDMLAPDGRGRCGRGRGDRCCALDLQRPLLDLALAFGRVGCSENMLGSQRKSM